MRRLLALCATHMCHPFSIRIVWCQGKISFVSGCQWERTVGKQNSRRARGKACKVEHAHLRGQPEGAWCHTEESHALCRHARHSPGARREHVGHIVAADGVDDLGAREVTPPQRVGSGALVAEESRVEAPRSTPSGPRYIPRGPETN